MVSRRNDVALLELPSELLELVVKKLDARSTLRLGGACHGLADAARTVRCGARLHFVHLNHAVLNKPPSELSTLWQIVFDHEIAKALGIPIRATRELHPRHYGGRFNLFEVLDDALALAGGWSGLAARQRRDLKLSERRQAALARRRRALDKKLKTAGLGSLQEWRDSLRARGAKPAGFWQLARFLEPTVSVPFDAARVVELCVAHEKIEAPKATRRKMLLDALRSKGVEYSIDDPRLQLLTCDQFVEHGEMCGLSVWEVAERVARSKIAHPHSAVR